MKIVTVPPRLKVIFGIVGTVFLVGGIFCLISTFRAWSEANASEKWPFVPGVIQRSRVVVDYSQKDDDYYVALVYEYSVDGRTYLGDRIRADGRPEYDREVDALNALTIYPVGKPVRVWYNPDDPTRSVLKTGGQGSTLAYGLVIAVGLLGAAMILGNWVLRGVRLPASLTPAPAT